MGCVGNASLCFGGVREGIEPDQCLFNCGGIVLSADEHMTRVLGMGGVVPDKMLSDSSKPLGGVIPLSAFEQTG